MGALKGVPKLVASDQKIGHSSFSVPKILGAWKGVPKLVASNWKIRYLGIESMLRHGWIWVFPKQHDLNELVYDL